MSVIVGKTIDQLNAATAITANDEVAIYDAEAGAAEPTKKVTGSNLASSIKTLGSLLGTSDVVNDLTSTATDKPLSANMGKYLLALLNTATFALTSPDTADALDTIIDDMGSRSVRITPSGVYNGVVKDLNGDAGGVSWFVITYKYSASVAFQWEFYFSSGGCHIYARNYNNGTWGTVKTVV